MGPCWDLFKDNLYTHGTQMLVIKVLRSTQNLKKNLPLKFDVTQYFQQLVTVGFNQMYYIGFVGTNTLGVKKPTGKGQKIYLLNK